VETATRNLRGAEVLHAHDSRAFDDEVLGLIVVGQLVSGSLQSLRELAELLVM
jgi:hypothetical protein